MKKFNDIEIRPAYALHSMTPNAIFMKRALELASSPKNCVLPNPRVGAVIVKNNKIIGEGFHRGPGMPHAEVEAIRNAKSATNGADLYVTLEPCCHTNKRTPPCVPLLVKQKFKQIFIAQRDPNPEVSGKGIAALRKAGIKIHEGLLKDEALKLNQAYLKNQQKKLPYVTLKLAMTFDGKLADDFGRSNWITSELARNYVHQLRTKADAIAVGSKTIDSDNPSLNARLSGHKASPKKILIFGTPQKPLARLKASKLNGPENVLLLKSTKPLKAHLKSLYIKEKVSHIFLEGGPGLASEFLRQGLVDELVLIIGLGILGGEGRYSLGQGWGLKRLQKSIKFEPENVSRLGPDVLIQTYLYVYGADSKFR